MGVSSWVLLAACFGVAWGKFAEWNHWSTCTSACAKGKSRRERLLPPGPGEYCHTTIIEQKACTGTSCARTTLVSQGKSTRSSSNLFNLYPAKYAVDGQVTKLRLSEKSCMHTEKEKNPWLMVDLSKTHIVHRVTLYNREECCQDYLNKAYVTVGNDPSGLTNPVCGRVGDIEGMKSISIICGSPLLGRYVHARIPGYQYLVICEFQVYGQVNTEISRGMGVTMSPQEGSNYPSYAVDGSTSSIAVTKRTKDPFLTIDLGSTRYVSQVAVFARGAPYNETVITFGDSKVAKENVVCATIPKTEKVNTLTLNCPIVRPGRFLTMRMNGTDNQITVAEIRAYGF